jgi:Tfp pilus assembly protein PilV
MKSVKRGIALLEVLLATVLLVVMIVIVLHVMHSQADIESSQVGNRQLSLLLSHVLSDKETDFYKSGQTRIYQASPKDTTSDPPTVSDALKAQGVTSVSVTVTDNYAKT